VKPDIDVALVWSYPSEQQAREALSHTTAPYLGVWAMPLPYGARVHVFGDQSPEELTAAGWTKEDA
jgi:hypothetical protein